VPSIGERIDALARLVSSVDKAARASATAALAAASKRVEARLSDLPTLRDAVHAWLCRTPIQGSPPDDPHDAENVRAFVESYLLSHARATETAKALAKTTALTPDDEARLDARYEREKADTRAYLFAEDVPREEERPRATRLRAALVFIESYRELPLLAWPREVVDALVAFEQGFVVFRQRHARMVERMIGHIQKEEMALLPILEDVLDADLDAELAALHGG